MNELAVPEVEPDFTESELAARRDALLGQLTAGVAHYFNNLMTPVLGFSELLLQEPHLDDPTRGGLEEIHRAGRQVSAVTAQLLTLARQQGHRPERLMLNELVADVAVLARPVLGSGIQLTTVLAPALRPAWADRGRLRLAVLTLLLRAREVTPRGGRVWLATAGLTVDQELASGRPEVHPGEYAAILVSVGDKGPAPRAELCFTTEDTASDGAELSAVRRLLCRERGYLAVAGRARQPVILAVLLPPVDQ